jgi:hypothetical protein
VRKRLRKKIGKRQCLKCGSSDGVRQWSPDRNGKFRVSRLACYHCDMGMPREGTPEYEIFLMQSRERWKGIWNDKES